MMRLAVAFCCLAGLAQAQSDPAAAAQAAAAQLETASAQLEAAQSASDRVAALTQTVRAYEDGLIAMREGLRRAAIREQTILTQLDAKSVEVARLLGVLQSIQRTPAPLSTLHPSGALGTARAGIMTADIAPALQSEVEALRAELAEVAILQRLQETATGTLEKGLAGAQDARLKLGEALSNRTDLPRRFDADRAQTDLLLASTETLEAFAVGLTEGLPGDPVAEARANGDLALPVQGEVLRGFNSADAAGVVRPGVIIAARPRALVTAPAAATVLFAGPLLEYGNVVILEPSADVLFVIAGLSEVYGVAGEIVAGGAPIGLLGGTSPTVDGILTESDAGGSGTATQTLYLEVRDGQTPVDPADWFALD